MGAGLLSRREKQRGHEVDHSCPSGAKVKNEWSYTSTPPTCLHGVDIDNFTFYLYPVQPWSQNGRSIGGGKPHGFPFTQSAA